MYSISDLLWTACAAWTGCLFIIAEPWLTLAQQNHRLLPPWEPHFQLYLTGTPVATVCVCQNIFINTTLAAKVQLKRGFWADLILTNPSLGETNCWDGRFRRDKRKKAQVKLHLNLHGWRGHLKSSYLRCHPELNSAGSSSVIRGQTITAELPAAAPSGSRPSPTAALLKHFGERKLSAENRGCQNSSGVHSSVEACSIFHWHLRALFPQNKAKFWKFYTPARASSSSRSILCFTMKDLFWTWPSTPRRSAWFRHSL